jgi:tRNA (adenine22-N1)-methyltransferase
VLPVPHLDQRLKVVANQIRCRTHADIGSDHGHLLKALLSSGRIEHGIAIENKHQPFENSKRTLADLSADVRFFDGFAGLEAGEADSVSICGMGGKTITRLLTAHPDRLPATIIVQPNNCEETLRAWGLEASYHLVNESMATGTPRAKIPRRFVILRFERATSSQPDPAYKWLDRESALLFGPHFIRRQSDEFVAALQAERTYLQSLPHLSAKMTLRRAAIEQLLPK